MSLPSISKQWMFCVNNVIPTDGGTYAFNNGSPPAAPNGQTYTTNLRLLFLIKDLMTGSFGTWTDMTGTSIPTPTASLWTTRYSTNYSISSTASSDGQDKWGSDWEANPNRIVWGSQNVYVLKNPKIMPNFQICINPLATSAGAGTLNNQSLLTLRISPSGTFSGGTWNSAINSSDELIFNQLQFGGWQAFATTSDSTTSFTGLGIGHPLVVHYMVSTDGKSHRFLMTRDQKLAGLWMFETVTGTPTISGWNPATYVIMAGERYGETGTVPQRNVCQTLVENEFMGYAIVPNGGIACKLYGETTNGQLIVDAFNGQINTLTSDFLITNVALVSLQNSTQRWCSIPDLWFSSAPNGSTFPSSGSKQYAQIGNFLVPWNGGSVTT